MDRNKIVALAKKHHEVLRKLGLGVDAELAAAEGAVGALEASKDTKAWAGLATALVEEEEALSGALDKKASAQRRAAARLALDIMRAATADDIERLVKAQEQARKGVTTFERTSAASDAIALDIERERVRPEPKSSAGGQAVPVPSPWEAPKDPELAEAELELKVAEALKKNVIGDEPKPKAKDWAVDVLKRKDVLVDTTVAANVATVSIAGSAASGASSQGDMARSQRVMAHSLASLADPDRGVGSENRPLRIQMRRADVPETEDTPLWLNIRSASNQLGWTAYATFMEGILDCDPASPPGSPGIADGIADRVASRTLRLPFPDADAYRFLKAATEVFMMVACETWRGRFTDADVDYARRRNVGTPRTADEIAMRWARHMSGHGHLMLPYLALIREKLGDQHLVSTWSREPGFPDALAACSGIVQQKLLQPCYLELIHSYWLEEGMLCNSLAAITRRFQNVRGPGERDPLAGMEIDPLRPLNNVLWGYIQDEQHRLTMVRRAYEYDHHYGLSLVGRAAPEVRGADSRTQFIEAFHTLLHLCLGFFAQDDDTTVVADGFPVLNALRDVHLVLTQGAHNQYGDLPWTARHEMLMQQWILARPEFREFLPTRIMVAYPEPWMDRVDAMKSLMGWTDTSILHFRDLAIFGERILLGARFNDWNGVSEPERAANWARYWRPEIQGYVHAYRAVTGIDLAERVDATRPSLLLRRRLVTQRALVR